MPMLKPTQNTGISAPMSPVNCLKRGALLKKKSNRLCAEAGAGTAAVTSPANPAIRMAQCASAYCALRRNFLDASSQMLSLPGLTGQSSNPCAIGVSQTSPHL